MAVRQAWARGVRRPAIVLPTGTGKTVVFAILAVIMHELGVRSVVLAHRDELIEQAVTKLRQSAPGLRVGVLKAGRNEIRGRDVIVASVQSLARAERRRAELVKAGIRLVIVDEAHHAVANTYMSVLRDLGCFEEDPMIGAYALGVTATMGRTDRVALGQVWEEIAFRKPIIDCIREGYLANAKGIRVRVDGLDLTTVRRSRGDYTEAALATAMHDALAPKAVARAYVEHAAGRQGIAFTPTVALAYEMAEAFEESGIACEAIDGAMASSDRRAVLTRFARGQTQVVANCAILTEGFDAPWCSAVVVARPTQSASLYVQMVGRALRPHPGKRDALIIDVVGVTGKHRLASLIDLAGADRVEKLPDDLAEYDEIDLLDLGIDRDDRTAGSQDVAQVDGPLVSEIVDLFGSSHRAWLRTHRGVWFLSAGEKLIFLAPAEDVGRYSVGRCSSRGQSGEWLQQDVDLSMAMTWGEQYAQEGDAATLTRKGARWRAGAPSQSQRGAAERLGLVVGGMTRGEVSDALSVAFASRRLDTMPCVASVSQTSYW